MTVQTFRSSPLIVGQLATLPKASRPPHPPDPVVRRPTDFVVPVLRVGVASVVDASAELVAGDATAALGDSGGTDGEALAAVGPARTVDIATVSVASIASGAGLPPDRFPGRTDRTVFNINSPLTKHARSARASECFQGRRLLAIGLRTLTATPDGRPGWRQREPASPGRVGAAQ
ncbi:MAG TPA: hypothetical protein VGD43_03185 [Micromonospora sp.]